MLLTTLQPVASDSSNSWWDWAIGGQTWQDAEAGAIPSDAYGRYVTFREFVGPTSPRTITYYMSAPDLGAGEALPEGLAATQAMALSIRATVGARIVEIEAGILGCGVYEIGVFERGGATMIGSLPFDSLAWARDLDAVSEATLQITGISGAGAACCALLGSIKPWQHELAMYRDGTRVWAGPITTIDVLGEVATISARDVMQWMWIRRLRHDHAFVATDLATIFQAYVTDALTLDNSMGLVVVPTPTGVTGDRSVLALQHMIAGDQLDELSRTGVDWTTIDRSVFVGGTVTPYPLPPTGRLVLIDDSFQTPPRVTTDGMQMATDWVVRGAGGGDGPDPVFGEAGGLSATFGLVDRVETNEEILDSPSAAAQAASRLALTGGGATVVSEGILSPDAGVTIDQLVPGLPVELRLVNPCLQILVDYRLASVKVTAGATQDEQVTLSFQPLGSA